MWQAGQRACFLAPWHVVPGQDINRQLVGLAVEVLEQGICEDCVVGGCHHKQSQAGPEFQIVGIAEDLFSAVAVHIQDKLRTFAESGTQPALFMRVRDETAKTPRETGARSYEGRRHT